eukprot:TRINITY_DN22415_c0_g1_i1.p1 TRINITY_DN22415_c0_g1~~TRINITY_DN22415_c0_g1_i1.p1  ORF type:complete len:805 (+),score=344.21 TRINITY_DN22415_c0_g1_i1:98-2512(+)
MNRTPTPSARPPSVVIKKLENVSLNRQPSQKGNLIDDARVCEFIRTRRAVVSWIERVLELRAGQLGDDLHASLRSGALLCFVMLEIDPSSIPRVQDGQGLKEYKLRENMLFFLQAVRDYGVPAHMLFSANDLYNNTNMATVVECLAQLAKLAESKSFRTPLLPVTPEGDHSDTTIKKQLTADQLHDLKEQIARLKTAPGQTHRVKIAPAIMRLRMQLVVGKDFERLERGFTRLQAVFRGNQQRLAHRKMVRDQAYRDKVAKEILTTEEHYVRDLKACIKAYLTPLRDAIMAKKKDFKNPDDMIKLFNDFEVIYQFNQRLLEQLRPVVVNWSSAQCVGKIFLGLMDFLKMYATYIMLIDKVLIALQDAQANKSSKLFKLLQELKDDPETRMLDLPSFLIMPVQRVPRYAMLLKDLTKHTWEGHPDLDALRQASVRADDISMHLNERKRQAENMTVLLELQSALQGKDAPRVVTEGRSFLRHGTFMDASSRAKEIVVYIFSDIVLVCDKRDATTLKYRETHDLAGVNFVADTGRDDVLIVTDAKSRKPLLSLMTAKKLERDKWVKDFELLKPKGDSLLGKAANGPKADVQGAENELLTKYNVRTGRMSGAYRPLTASVDAEASPDLDAGKSTPPRKEFLAAPAEPIVVPSSAARAAPPPPVAPSRKVCQQCGEEVVSKFCIYCGTPAGWSPASSSDSVPSSPSRYPSNALTMSAGSTSSAAESSHDSTDDASSDSKKDAKKAEKLKKEQEKAAEKLRKQQEKDAAKEEKNRKKDERKSKRISGTFLFFGDSQAGKRNSGSSTNDSD